jgi:tetratricopeptide (TPR) repeat protein
LEARRKIGLIHLEKEEWAAAAQAFSAILEYDPDLDQIRFYLGSALERLADWPGALEAFQAIPVDSELHADSLSHVSYIFFRLGRPADAIAVLEGLFEQDPGRPELYTFLASLQEAEGKFAAAAATLERGLLAHPEATGLLYEKGVLLERRGDRDGAVAVMQQVLQRDPDHAEALNFIAYAWAEQEERLEEALRMARRALQIKNEGHIIDTLGWVYFKLGRLEEARQELETAAGLLADDPVVLEHLGDVYRGLGLSARARSAYQQVLELSPAASGVAEKLRTLPPE